MIKIKVELYKPPVSTIFRGLPGYDLARRHTFGEGEFWAVVIPKPRARTSRANWIAPIPPDASYPIGTMGTEPLPEGTKKFNVSKVCIKGYKYNPYFYKITAPSSTVLEPLPASHVAPGNTQMYFCRAVFPAVAGIGIWIVALSFDNANKLPEAPHGREAVFEPDRSVPGVTHGDRQPYLILSDGLTTKYDESYSKLEELMKGKLTISKVKAFMSKNPGLITYVPKKKAQDAHDRLQKLTKVKQAFTIDDLKRSLKKPKTTDNV